MIYRGVLGVRMLSPQATGKSAFTSRCLLTRDRRFPTFSERLRARISVDEGFIMRAETEGIIDLK